MFRSSLRSSGCAVTGLQPVSWNAGSACWAEVSGFGVPVLAGIDGTVRKTVVEPPLASLIDTPRRTTFGSCLPLTWMSMPVSFSSDRRYLKVPGFVARKVYVDVPLFWNITSTPSIWFCQSGSPAATSENIVPAWIETWAVPVSSAGFESGLASAVTDAWLIGLPTMSAVTLIVHVTDAPAPRPAWVHVTVPAA